MSARRRAGEERLYYSPPAMRMHNQQQQQQQSKFKSSSGSGSNFDRFMEHTTPVVQAHYLTRTSTKMRRNRNNESHPYFILGDLWESFREWSAYGAGVPLVMNGNDSVVQYYWPSLSAIQLYVDPSRPCVEQNGRRPGEEGDAYSSRETSSDGDSEYGTDNSSLESQRPVGRNTVSTKSSIDGDDISNLYGKLIFNYCENKIPYIRETLVDKLATLASDFPQLKTYRSCDLTDSSWISVAWYPIYRIPVGPTLQNVDACFLTFHCLTKPVKSGNYGGSKLALPAFGLVTRKVSKNISGRDKDELYEDQKVKSLFQAAENWIRPLKLDYPDKRYFFETHTI